MRLRRGPAYVGLAVTGFVLGWLNRPALVADHVLFERAGRNIATVHWHAVYADPTVQAGPFELLFFAFWRALDPILPGGLSRSPDVGPGLSLLTVLGTPVLALGAAAGVRRLRASAGTVPSLFAELAAGALVLAASWSGGLLDSGHPAGSVIPVLWMVAALRTRNGRGAWAGVLIGAAAGWETWGVLAVPVLLLAPRRASIVRGCAGLAATVAGLYLPFAVAGPFRMFQYHWGIGPGTLVHHLLPAAGSFSWWMRWLQAILALAAAGVVALLLRHPPPGPWDAIWLVPLVAVAVRLVLDPVAYPYYWLTPMLLALAAVCVRDWPALHDRREADDRLGRAVRLIPVLALFVWQTESWGTTCLGTLLLTLPLCAVQLALARAGRRIPVEQPAVAVPSAG